MIRKALPKDCKNLAALSIQVWLNTYARDGINTIVTDYVLDTLTEQHFVKKLADSNYQLYVFVEGDNLLGFIAIDLNSFWKGAENGFEIDTLYIQNRQQGKGIGRALLRHVSEQHGNCYWLTTWSKNVEGLSFYNHIGFKDIDVSYFELDGEKHENRVLMYRKSPL